MLFIIPYSRSKEKTLAQNFCTFFRESKKKLRRAGLCAPPAAANMISVTLLDDFHKLPWLLKSTSARRVPLRCGTQLASYQRLIVLRMTVTFAGEKSKIRCTPLISRGRNRARSGNGTHHVPFPSSKAVKAPPGLCQENAFSPSMKSFASAKDFIE